MPLAKSATTLTVSRGLAVSGTTPSCSAFCQRASNSAGLSASFHASRQWAMTISRPVRCGAPTSLRSAAGLDTSVGPNTAASTSISDRPSNSGAISGCMMVAVPSNARVSPHVSKKWASGKCQSHSVAVSSWHCRCGCAA